jgi:hypothetical protein
MGQEVGRRWGPLRLGAVVPRLEPEPAHRKDPYVVDTGPINRRAENRSDQFFFEDLARAARTRFRTCTIGLKDIPMTTGTFPTLIA